MNGSMCAVGRERVCRRTVRSENGAGGVWHGENAEREWGVGEATIGGYGSIGERSAVQWV